MKNPCETCNNAKPHIWCNKKREYVKYLDCYFYGSNNKTPEQEANECKKLITDKMPVEYKYLSFIEEESKTKTKVFAVVNKLYEGVLGAVMWYAPWRKYCFFTADEIILDAFCLADIQDFLNSLMAERRNK